MLSWLTTLGWGTFTHPTVWKVAAGVLLAAFLSATGYHYGWKGAEHKWTKKYEDLQADVAQKEIDQLQLLNDANEANRELEKKYAKQVASIRAQYAAEEARARADDDRTIADLRSGLSRLHLRITACDKARPSGARTAPGGANEARTAELTPETAAALTAIAADGDRAIRKLTGLQAWSASALNLCGPTKTE